MSTGLEGASEEFRSDSPRFADLCRTCLGEGMTVRFRAEGTSMRPALLPGDVVSVAPLGDEAPMPGEVVMFRTGGGRVAVHRVVARRRKGEDWLVVTAGDGHRGSVDAAVSLDDVLGKVVGLERGGVVVALPQLQPGLWTRLKAARKLSAADVGGACEDPRTSLPGWLRRGAKGCLAGLAQVRRVPGLADVVRLLAPDLRGRCSVAVSTPDSVLWQGCVYVDVVWRGRSVSRLTIQPDGAGGEGGGSWWLSGAYTQPLQRNRGAAGLALAEAIARAREHAVAAVYAVVSDQEPAARAVLRNAGFAPVDPERAQDLMQRRDPPVDPPNPDAVVYCLELPPAS